MSSDFSPYPIIAVAPVSKSSKDVQTGIVSGEDIEEETKKRIWTQAAERQIEDTPTNRALAYDIDGLVKFITNIKRYSILNSYTLLSNDDVKHEALKLEIDEFLTRIKLLSTFRQVFTPLTIEGRGHLQKLFDGSTLAGFAVLRHLKRYNDPTNIADYYFYQSQKVSTKWRDPEETETKELRVWYIDETKRKEYTTIKDDKDLVLDRELVIEFLNNEAGESNMQTVVSYVFIKNFLIQLLPNLIEIITSPNEEIIYATVDKAGVPCIPKMPPESLKTVDSSKYTEEVAIYKRWKTNLAQLANQISNDRTKQRKTIHPDTIVEKVFESAQSSNTDLIKSLVHILNTEIAHGMGFSLSLLDAAGSEMATARTIYSTVAVVMRGIQQQFEVAAQALINEEFPAAIEAGIEYRLAELQPEDKLISAEQKKLHAETAEILSVIGFEVENYATTNIDETLEIFGGEEGKEAAEEVVEAMLDYRNLQVKEIEGDVDE
jgi:hypothetical protein